MEGQEKLGEILEMETFWIKNYVAPRLRSQIDGSAIFLVVIGLLNFGVGMAFLVERPFSLQESLFIYLSMGLSMFTGVFSLLVISMSYARPTTHLRRGEQTVIDNAKMSLFKDIRDLAAKMACLTPFTILFEGRTGSCVPSVLKLRHNVYGIVVPAGLMRRKPEERRALLAHEIAHIKQDDIELWLACDRLAAGLRIVAAMLLTVLAVSWIVLLSAVIVYGLVQGIGVPSLGLVIWIIIAKMIINDLPYAATLFQILVLRTRVKDFKRYSEIRADLAAIVHANGTKLRSALSFLALNSRREKVAEDGDHPAGPARLELVDNTIRYWQLSKRSQDGLIWYRYP